MRAREMSKCLPTTIALSPARPDRLQWQAFFHRLVADLRARRQRARDIAALAVLTDYELRDLSLSRVDVRALAEGTFRPDAPQ